MFQQLNQLSIITVDVDLRETWFFSVCKHRKVIRDTKEKIMKVESELSSARLENDVLKALKNSICSYTDWEVAEAKYGHRYKASALFKLLVSKYI
jgi:hypothetical protein